MILEMNSVFVKFSIHQIPHSIIPGYRGGKIFACHRCDPGTNSACARVVVARRRSVFSRVLLFPSPR